MMFRSVCPICASGLPSQIEYQPLVPALLNLFSKSQEAAHNAHRGVLDLVGCTTCGFSWNRFFDSSSVPYDQDYENAGTHSPTFQDHAEQVVDKILAGAPRDQPLDVLEIGCGQGEFLRLLASRAGSRLRSAVGFDPAFRQTSVAQDRRIHIHNAYFDREVAATLKTSVNLIVARHVIDQVANPIEIFATARSCATAVAKIFVETPNFRWTLDRAEIQDLFYEHCSLFDPNSLRRALANAGFKSANIECVFGGQYLLAEADMQHIADDASQGTEASRFPDLREVRENFVKTWRSRCDTNNMVVWGAGGKGVTFCNLIDPDGSKIVAVIDLNPAKQGLFVPLSGHRVIAPTELESIQPDLIVLMNPNYRDEVAATLKAMDIKTILSVPGDMQQDAGR